MIVVDASAILELLIRTPQASNVFKRLFSEGEAFHAPHLIDVEIPQVLRRYVLRKDMSVARAEDALRVYSAMSIERCSHELLLDRIWALRSTLTAYDAAYVALAELLDAPLVTRDRRLAASSGHSAVIELV